MQKITLILSLLFLSAFCLPVQFAELQVLWNAWKDVHHKSYTPAEDTARFAIFVENYKVIIKHNAQHTSHKLGLNIFADLTIEEFKAKLSSSLSDRQYSPEDTLFVPEDTFSVSEDTVIPTSVDWRKKKAVTSVPMVGEYCTSTWAFSVAGVLEGMRAIKSGKLDSLSAQQLVDCEGNFGCQGDDNGQTGLSDGLTYAAKYGLELNNDYPYTGDVGKCVYNASRAIHINTGYVRVQSNNETALKAAIATMPTAVSFDVSTQAFQLYVAGVITDECVADYVDSSGLAVGYGVIDGDEAYYIRNALSAMWGDHGYVYISTNPSQNDGKGVCGVLTRSYLAK